MSQTTPPIHGQIEAPNPLELFWDKNKRIVLFGLTAAAIAVVINYAWQYMQRREQAARWSEFAEATALDRGYVQSGKSWPLYSQFLIPRSPHYLFSYLAEARSELASRLPEDLEQADGPALERLAQGKDARAPLAIWLLAYRSIDAQDWDAAEQQLQRLQRDFPSHFLCQESPFPVQYREPVEKRDENGDPVEADANKPPELEAPQPGSAVSRLLASVQAEREFRQQNQQLYQPQDPDSAETVTFQFAGFGPVKIRLFTGKSPEHVAKFLDLARAGWWQKQRVYEIRRPGDESLQGASAASELRFGWPSTTSDETTTWVPGDVAEEHLVGWEDNDLSHFPGTVSVEPAKEGKSEVERIVINADDAASQADGTRVIIGRVIEGLDVIREIVNGDFADEQAARQGQGRPSELITIDSVTVEG